ncbi:MAG: galactose mutarotase [Spirochaetaceae bacterium]|jgi:aldose 1-epimerase|nr:galactose mutarotase [Spirochaetaceae bacterium]
MAIKGGVSTSTFGRFPNGREGKFYTLKNDSLELTLLDYGASMFSLEVPGRKGTGNVLLGFDTPEGWSANTIYLNSTVGRFCNRIADASFNLNGKKYTLDANDGKNCLHSGRDAFYNRFWDGIIVFEGGDVYVRFELESPDGDGGFPGNVKAAVTYGLTAENKVHVLYEAKVDCPCPLSFTNHAYWNLTGVENSTILKHAVSLNSSRYLELDGENIPTGRILPVEGTPFDFRTPKPVERDMAGCYDHPFIIDKTEDKLMAAVHDPESGRTLKVRGTQPALHFYSGTMIPSVPGREGYLYDKHSGFCLEPEYYPDSPNHPEYPSAIFTPERPYEEKIIFEFDW